MKSDYQRVIASSELIINSDGTIFHLHMRPEQLKDNIILVGDPGRVALVANHFDSIEAEGSSREFVWCSGRCNNKDVTVLSTGIGADNIDIVITELDALANIDFTTRTVKPIHRQLNFIRIGTSGTVQPDICLGDAIVSTRSIGFDSGMAFYEGVETYLNHQLTNQFKEYSLWQLPFYGVDASSEMIEKFGSLGRKGITITAPGFYGAQGRNVRLTPKLDNFTTKLELFRYNSKELITNIEMESAPIALMAKMLNHRAITICLAIAQRKLKNSSTDYQELMNNMIKKIINLL